MVSFPDAANAWVDAVAARVLNQLVKQLHASSPAVEQRLYSVADAAKYLGRTKVSVQHLISDGTLRVVKFDKRNFVAIEDLQQLVAAHKSGM